MWTRVRAFIFLASLTFTAAASAGSPISGFQETVFQGGLTGPTAIAFLPDGRMLITEQGGALKLSDGTSVSTLITIPVCSAIEMGLLGVAVDPNFTSNGFVYLYRTKNPGSCATSTGRFNEVVRITIGPGDTVNPASLTVLVTGAQTDGGNHNGGCLRIGPDGKLYVGVGDTGLGDNQGGPGSSTNPYSQDLSVLMGKVLRINLPDGSIPADNPFFNQAGKRGEIFAYGFRNPFRFSFDPVTGKLWLADVGDSTVEEIDIVTSGGNYAWPHCEGTLPAGCEQPGDIDPIFTYLHSGSSSLGTCIIGGGFAPAGFGGLGNDYFFGDCTSSNIYSAAPTGAQRDGVSTPASFLSGGNTPSDVIFGPDGALYYVAESGNEVRRVAPTTPDQPVFGSKLTLKDNAINPAKKSLTMLAKDGIVLGDDPRIAGGSLEVVSQVPGAAFDQCYCMPAANWSVIGNPTDHKGFKYKDGKLLAGPVKSAQVKTNKLVKASGKGSALGFSLGATSPDPVTVILSMGTRRYCATFGGTTKFTASKSFSAKLADNPPSCPPSNCPCP
jgi:glucose/arabinose dehydrogenase